MLELPKVRFLIVCLGILLFSFGYVEREYTILQYVVFSIFFLINTYVLVHSFFFILLEDKHKNKKLDYVSVALILLLNIFSILTGYSRWVLAYTSVIILCFVVVPFAYHYFNSYKDKKKRKRKT